MVPLKFIICRKKTYMLLFVRITANILYTTQDNQWKMNAYFEKSQGYAKLGTDLRISYERQDIIINTARKQNPPQSILTKWSIKTPQFTRMNVIINEGIYHMFKVVWVLPGNPRF